MIRDKCLTLCLYDIYISHLYVYMWLLHSMFTNLSIQYKIVYNIGCIHNSFVYIYMYINIVLMYRRIFNRGQLPNFSPLRIWFLKPRVLSYSGRQSLYPLIRSSIFRSVVISKNASVCLSLTLIKKTRKEGSRGSEVNADLVVFRICSIRNMSF